MNWEKTINFVKQIPYGRNSNREDFSLVISENKGTCSSKHAYLKDFANRNNIPNVQLIVLCDTCKVPGRRAEMQVCKFIIMRIKSINHFSGLCLPYFYRVVQGPGCQQF